VSVQLSPAGQYGGGGMQVGLLDDLSTAQGTAIVFPSCEHTANHDDSLLAPHYRLKRARHAHARTVVVALRAWCADQVHKVHPVTRGVRKSLVGWVVGAPPPHYWEHATATHQAILDRHNGGGGGDGAVAVPDGLALRCMMGLG
jgi:hypothetical protein